jgi:hypothetical protein
VNGGTAQNSHRTWVLFKSNLPGPSHQMLYTTILVFTPCNVFVPS